MIGSGGTKRASSRYTAPPAASYYPLCGLLSYRLVLAFGLVLCGFRAVQAAAAAICLWRSRKRALRSRTDSSEGGCDSCGVPPFVPATDDVTSAQRRCTARYCEEPEEARLRLGLPQHAVLYFDGKTSHGRSKDGVLRRPPHVPLAWEEPAFRDAAAAVVRGSADAELYALAVSAHERAVAALQPNFANELGAFRTLLGEARQACTRAAWRRSGRGTDGCYNHGRENGCLYTCLDGFK